MTCKEYEAFFTDYLTGQLDRRDRDRLDAHVLECESCRLELENLKTTWEALGTLPDEDPSPALSGRFYAVLEDEKRRLAAAAGRTDRAGGKGWIGRWLSPRPALQFAPALLFLVAGLWIGSQFQPNGQRDDEIIRLRAEFHDMQQTVALSLMDKSSTSDRLQGVQWSAQVDDPSENLLASLIKALNNDPSVNVRLAAADALSLFADVPGVVEDLTYSLSQQTSPLVQVSIIDLLVSIKEKKSIDALREFIKSQNVNPTVKEHAENRMKDFT